MTTAFDDEFRLNFADTGDQLNFDPVPAGLYHCQITDASVKPAGDQAKHPGAPVLGVRYTIQDEPYEGRNVFDNIAMILDDGDPNSVWRRKLKGLLGALGYDTNDEITLSPEFFSELIGQGLDVKVGRQAASGQYEARNRANAFYPHSMTDSEMLS